jgi:hypothetical protein
MRAFAILRSSLAIAATLSMVIQAAVGEFISPGFSSKNMSRPKALPCQRQFMKHDAE